MTVFVNDSNPTRSVRKLPVTKNRDGESVHIHPGTEEEVLNDLGWWSVEEVAKPANTDDLTHRSRIVPNPSGPGYVMEWYHDPEAHANRLDRQDRENDRRQLKEDIAVLRDIAQDTQQTREMRQMVRIIRRVIRSQAMDE